MESSANPDLPGSGRQCHHAPCSCVVAGGSGVIAGERQYCSQGCAEGSGCDHETCRCVEGERAVG
jgi:hypothetical protein